MPFRPEPFPPCRSRQRLRGGLSLLELVIAASIVATLAILAAIHYQRAMIRSRVSRARSDMTALRSAIELYSIEHQTPPVLAGGMGLTGALEMLRRPEAYVPDMPTDPFTGGTYQYLAVSPRSTLPKPYFGSWVLSSAGPDAIQDTRFSRTILYDPTNGLLSAGDVVVASQPLHKRGFSFPVASP